MADLQDDLERPGEGQHGFPKTLPEDCVEYSIFVIGKDSNDHDVREHLRQVQKAALQMTKRLLKDFMWQRESFGLNLDREGGRSFLRGRTNFGDSTDDEWTVVYLLRELSSQFSDLWIRITDTDGEFLLIEAANALPIWLNPEVADFRVWIHGGELLIIPLEQPGGIRSKHRGSSDILALQEAINWIQNPNRTLQHSTKIEQEAFFRLKRYPEQISNSMHQGFVIIPRKLAHVLHNHPKSITAAVEAFYLRDAISLKKLQKNDISEYIFPPTDFVCVSVRSTKVGYAQLRSQQFPMPSMLEAEISPEDTGKLQARSEVGIKLLCGFEMLMSDSQAMDKSVVREISLILEDLASGDVQLPTDEEMKSWSRRDDDDSWLDIDYQDFERELAGETGQADDPVASAGSGPSNLRKTVQRFEQMLAQERDADSNEMIDDMDEDDDATDYDSEDSNSGGDLDLGAPNAQLGEDDFTKMMQELMGMPPGAMKEVMQNPKIAKTDDINYSKTNLLKTGNGSGQRSATAVQEDGQVDTDEKT